MLKNNWNKILRKLRKFNARVSWKFVAGFIFGILLFSTFCYLFVLTLSKIRGENIRESITFLFSIKPEVIEVEKEELDSQHFIKIISSKKDIVGDYILNYKLSDKLYEKCLKGYCLVQTGILEAGEIDELIGPSVVLESDYDKSGKVKVLKIAVEEFLEQESENEFYLVLKVYNEDNLLVSEVKYPIEFSDVI